MSSPIIEVRGVSKCYQIGSAGAGQFHTLRDRLASLFHQGGSQKEDFLALSDVSFDVQPGEVLGIIGANGAGKSTLLKILSRITEPTGGEIVLRGRVASLLEVGTGFHPELTGRENIFLNGVILGMRRAEVARKFDEIVAFSGVEKFLDTPVKRYSSGMYVRLAFAVAAHLDPEILIVDEVLAVGDAEFQEKCLGAMSRLGSEGRTVLFVSHNMTAISNLTSRCLVLAGGRCIYSGPSCDAVEKYIERNEQTDSGDCDFSGIRRPSWLGERTVELLGARLDGLVAGRLKAGNPLRFRVAIAGKVDSSGFVLVVKINARDGHPLGSAFSRPFGPLARGEKANLDIEIADPGFAPGRYTCSFIVVTSGWSPADAVHDVLRFDLDSPARLPAGQHAWSADWGHVRLEISSGVLAESLPEPAKPEPPPDVPVP
ncbi:MAG: polysaccharide ABC transporter ATP-binding protein [Verrucomicrobiae bacterium]